jgi:hypothetical protein
MRIPVDPAGPDMEAVLALVWLVRHTRDLSALRAKLNEQKTIQEAEVLSLAPSDLLQEFGLVRSGGSGGRFAQVATWTSDDVNAIAAIADTIEELRAEIDELVVELFGFGSLLTPE